MYKTKDTSFHSICKDDIGHTEPPSGFLYFKKDQIKNLIAVQFRLIELKA